MFMSSPCHLKQIILFNCFHPATDVGFEFDKTYYSLVNEDINKAIVGSNSRKDGFCSMLLDHVEMCNN